MARRLMFWKKVDLWKKEQLKGEAGRWEGGGEGDGRAEVRRWAGREKMGRSKEKEERIKICPLSRDIMLHFIYLAYIIMLLPAFLHPTAGGEKREKRAQTNFPGRRPSIYIRRACFGSGLILTESGSSLLGKTGHGSMFFSQSDPDLV